MALSVSRNPYTGLPDLIGTGGGGGGATFSGGMSTGGNTVGTTGFGTNRLVLAGGNNITLSGSTNGGAMTITISGAAGGGGNTGSISAGTTRGTLGEVVFSNSNGLSFGMNGQTLTGSHNGLTSQSNQAFSAQGGSSAFQTLSFNNANGATFSNQGGAVQLSYTVPSTAGLISAVNFSAGTTSNNSASIRFADSNGISFGLNAGTITATVATNYLTSQSNQAFSASGGSSTFQTLNFINGNGATFTNNAGSVGISYTVPSVPAQTNQTIGAYAVSNTTGAASSTTVDARSFSFQGAGIASVGMTNGSVVISVPSGGGAGDGGNVLAAGTQTANTTGTVVFSNSNGVTFGMSNNSVITASVAAAGGGIVRSIFNPQDAYIQAASQQGQGTMHMQPAFFPDVTFDRLMMPFVLSNSSNSTGTATLSVGFGIYTRNNSTLSLASSTSASWAVTYSGTASNSTYSGMRMHTIPWSSSISEGQYYVGIWSRTTTAGTNASWSQFVCSQIGSNLAGHIGSSSPATNQYTRGLGQYTATFSTALPNSVAFSQINGTAFLAMRQPVFALFLDTF